MSISGPGRPPEDLPEILEESDSLFEVEQTMVLPAPRHLRALRYLSGVTLAEVAEVVDVSTSTINNWERGKRSPRLEDVRELVEYYLSEM